jgi:hypothetical protein
MEYRVPITSLKAVINPLDGDMWKVAAIDPQEVRDAADKGTVCKYSWAELKNELPPELHRAFHISRIAWLLAVEPNRNDPHKLLLNVTKHRIWLFDGNHRVAAAIVRGDNAINLHIIDSGELDLALLLPGLTAMNDADRPAP